MHGRQVSQRVDVVAATEAERGAADQEVRDVGAQPRADARERRQVEVQLPELVQGQECHRRIGAAAAEPRLGGNALA